MTGCAVVVIGHVDHGKTTLVRALTGMDTDRLAEERARGLSIVPGYAHRAYAGGTVDFIDAPGHADFIRATVSAASGAGAAMLVVSARDGVQAQTLEHLRIVGLLGISQGVVVLSQCDGVAAADVAARFADLRGALAGTALADSPVLACSSATGAGLDALHQKIGYLVTQGASAVQPPVACLPVDRVFTVQGRGVVVTGTLLGGPLREGAALTVQPQGVFVTLRGLESRGAQLNAVEPGARCAANLRGIGLEDVAPGDMLCAGDILEAAPLWDVEISVLPQARGIKHMQQVRVLAGTQSAVAKVRLIEAPGQGVQPGETAFARLQFDAPQVAFAGQRAVLRHLSPAQTLGGAVVLDPVPEKPRPRASVLRAACNRDLLGLCDALAEAGAFPLTQAARLGRVSVEEMWSSLSRDHVRLGADRVMPMAGIDAARQHMLDDLRRYHAEHPLAAVAPRQTFALADDLMRHVEETLLADGAIRREGDGLALADHDPLALLAPVDRARMDELDAQLRAGGCSPPDLSATSDRDTALLALLLREGRLLRLHNVGLDQWLLFHAAAVDTARETLRAAFPPPTPFRTGAARDALATSRKFIVPLLEYLDSLSVTHRDGDMRHIALD